MVGETLSPAEKEVGEDEVGRVRSGFEPVEKRGVEKREDVGHWDEEGSWKVFGVFNVGRDGRVGREREDERLDGRGEREELGEEMEVLWGGEDGDA